MPAVYDAYALISMDFLTGGNIHKLIDVFDIVVLTTSNIMNGASPPHMIIMFQDS